MKVTHDDQVMSLALIMAGREYLNRALNAFEAALKTVGQKPLGAPVKLFQRGFSKIDDWADANLSPEAKSMFALQLADHLIAENDAHTEAQGALHPNGEEGGGEGVFAHPNRGAPAGVGDAGDDRAAGGQDRAGTPDPEGSEREGEG